MLCGKMAALPLRVTQAVSESLPEDGEVHNMLDTRIAMTNVAVM